MKQKFEVTIARTHFRTYFIEAESEDEAIMIMESRIDTPCEEEYGDEEILFNEFSNY